MNMYNRLANNKTYSSGLAFWHRFGATGLLLGIICLGAALRLYGLDAQSLWNDELSAWRHSSYDTLAQVIEKGVPADHPPGFLTFLFYWTNFVGDSEVLLRLPSALAGVFAIYAMFLLGRKLYSQSEGLIAAALTAVLWAPLYYSQEARANMLVMLVVILSVYWLIDIGQALKRDRKMPLTAVIGYLLTAITASYLHYFGLFFVLLQAAFMGVYFLRRPAVWFKLFAIYGIILVAYLPWFIKALTVFSSGGSKWSKAPPSDPFWKFARFLFNNSDILTYVVLLLWGSLLIRTIWTIVREPRAIRQHLFSFGALLTIWLIVPLILVYARTFISESIWNNRNFIIVVPAAYLLVARAITQLPYHRMVAPITALVLLAAITFQLLWIDGYYTQPHKEQFREAVALVIENDALYPDTPIIGWAWQASFLDYYFEHQGSPRRVAELLGKADDIEQARAFIAATDSRYIWFIAAHRAPEDEFILFLESEMDTVLHQSFIKADVWLFDKDSAANRQLMEGEK